MNHLSSVNRNRLSAVSALVLVIGLSLLVPSDVFAATCDENETVFIECGSGTNGMWAILLIVINVLTAGVGILAVGGIVYGALLWTTAEDKADQLSKAKTVITDVVIGIIAFALLYSGLQFLIPGGVFNRTSSVASVTNTTSNKLKTSDSGESSSGGSGDESGSESETVTLSGVDNFRDASTSKIIKPGLLYRSGKLQNATNKDVKQLSKILSGGTIIDLRDNAVRAREPDKAVPQTSVFNTPIHGTLDYTEFVEIAASRNAFGKAITKIANTNKPALVHCTYGKDRTGWIVAMVMYAIGANDQQVMQEYMRSAPSGEVKKAWLNAGLSKAKSEYGSIPKYLKNGLGLNDTTLNKLKTRLKAS